MTTPKIPQEKTILINQTIIAYYEQGKGETILLLHGWPQTSYAWRKIFPKLSQKYHVVAVDLPGCGNSGAAPNYSTKNIALLINSTLTHLIF